MLGSDDRIALYEKVTILDVLGVTKPLQRCINRNIKIISSCFGSTALLRPGHIYDLRILENEVSL